MTMNDAAKSGLNSRFAKFQEYIGHYGNPQLQITASFSDEIHLAIPKEEIAELGAKLCHELGFELIQLLGSDERQIQGQFALYYVFAQYQEGYVAVLKTEVAEGEPSFPSLTPTVPSAHWYEREIRDLFGLEPKGHPEIRRLAVHKDWPKGLFPLRKDFRLQTEVPRSDGKFTFSRVEGEGVMQIPVGPIHAGIIEPGHFRFSVVGENVLNLEARFFYTHRGMEKIAEGKTPRQGVLVAERMCGACSFAHSSAYCLAIEKLSGTVISKRAEFIRTIGLELERLYNHIGDVGNICAGLGFAFGTMYGARLKEELQHLNETVFGSRFLRGINAPGGVRRDISDQNRELILGTLAWVEREFRELTEILLTTESYLDRVQGTGILRYKIACDLHAVGPAARAAGIARDTRRDLPHLAYGSLNFEVPVYTEGDVLARVKIRIDETFQSIGIVRQALDLMPPGKLLLPLEEMTPYGHAVGITESARGENVHFVMVGGDGKIFRHMVRSASYCNWPVVPSTIPGNIVPDFPLINKSFELCYSCLDR
ncbi:MAG: hydrogenase large subunit [Desulfitobacteriaceae bacterium]